VNLEVVVDFPAQMNIVEHGAYLGNCVDSHLHLELLDHTLLCFLVGAGLVEEAFGKEGSVGFNEDVPALKTAKQFDYFSEVVVDLRHG